MRLCMCVCVCACVRVCARASASIPVLDPRNVPHTRRGGSGRKHKSGLTPSAPRRELWPANLRSAEVSSLVQCVSLSCSLPLCLTPTFLSLSLSLSVYCSLALSLFISLPLSPSLSLSLSRARSLSLSLKHTLRVRGCTCSSGVCEGTCSRWTGE